MSEVLDELQPKRNVIISDFQLVFRNHHSPVNQDHRVTSVTEKAFEEKTYCPASFSDVSQTFDIVWHQRDGQNATSERGTKVNCCSDSFS